MSPTTSRRSSRKAQPTSGITPAPGPETPKKPTRARKSRAQTSPAAPVISEAQRRLMIAEAAYYLAQRRGFAGDERLADWYTAEAQIAALLEGGTTTTNH